MTATIEKQYQYKSLSALQKWLTVSLWCDILLNAIAILGLALLFSNFNQGAKTLPTTDLNDWLDAISLVYWAEFLPTIVIATSLLIWMHRAFANLKAAGIKQLSYSPKAAVGWWFVPLANFYKPYGAMTELRLASDSRTDLENWYPGHRTSIIGLWWMSWIASKCASQWGSNTLWASNPVEGVLKNPPSWMHEQTNIGMLTMIASSVLQIVAAVLLMRLTRQITSNQKTKFESRPTN